MIPLSAYGTPHRVGEPIIGKIIAADDIGPWHTRVRRMPNWLPDADLSHCDAVLCGERVPAEALGRVPVPVVHAVNLDHVAEGDVVALDSRGHVRTLYRRASRHNALFATDRCNSFCLMCSQPPRTVDDDDWRIREMLAVIDLIDPTTPELGITGGEPTLLKDGFLDVVRACKVRLPQTALHVLSNGRMFRYGTFARRLAEIQHADLMVGIPLYSDLDDRHDHVVQVKGAFEETLTGLHNLGRSGVSVEIRVVIHRFTYERLPQLAEFIYRNVTFASQVALMGLELMGFAVRHLDALWIDPWEYRDQLERATLFLAGRGMQVSVYNHQFCTVPESIWPFCRKSISDWKNDYLPQCGRCGVRELCGGFFTSAIQRRTSAHVRPIERSMRCAAV